MAKMFGIVRSRFETFISNNRLLPFNSRRFANPNTIGISKYASASFKGKGHHPQPPPLPTRMKDKLMNVLQRGIVSITGHTAIDNPYESIDEIGGKSNWRSSIKKFIYGADWDSREDFEFDKNDLASDENLWILYDRWINFHGLSRTPEEKQQHFQPFKESAHRVHYTNKIYKRFQCGLNLFADMTKEEKRMLCGGGVFNDQLSYEIGDKSNWRSFIKKFIYGADWDSRESFEFDKNDLASDENLWILYDRWINFHGLSRTPEEKQQHFQPFKESAHRVHYTNKIYKIFQCELNRFADMTKEEKMMLYGGGLFDDQLSCNKNEFGFRGIEVDSRKLFEFEEKDLASEDNLEKLYDQWICYFGLSRDPKEKDVHFQAFKKCVHDVCSSNIAFNIRRHEVNEYADTTREERRMRFRYGFRVEKKTETLARIDRTGHKVIKRKTVA